MYFFPRLLYLFLNKPGYENLNKINSQTFRPNYIIPYKSYIIHTFRR
jgi:hypothetical protein